MDEEDDSWEEEQSMLEEESSYGDDPWSDCSNTDFEEDPYEGDPEPVPPDPYHGDNHSTDWSRKEDDLEEGYESGSWREEAEAENSLENSESWEHESDEETQLQLDLSSGETHHNDEETWNPEDEPDDSFGTDSEHDEEAISEAGRNVTLVLAEEDEVESEAGRMLLSLKHTPHTFLVMAKETKLTYSGRTKWKPCSRATTFKKRRSCHMPNFKSVILEEFVKQDPDPDPSPMCAAHAVYAPRNPTIFKAGSKQANHRHSPQKMEPAVEKKTVKKQEGSQLRVRKDDGRPNHDERLKENQEQQLACPQNVEEDARSIKRTQAAKEQIILQLAETIWELRIP
ncbi:hypothetical protein Bca4012_063462 [Brassica carinata]